MEAPQNRMTEGSIPRQILLFALPVFLSNLFQQLYNTADSLIVGNFIGSEALAAVGSSGSLIFLMISFFTGISMGAGVLIARYFGAREAQAVERAVHTTMALGLASAAVLTVAGVALTPQILRLIGTPPEVLPNSVLYFRIYFFGVVGVVMYNVESGILQAVGDSRSPMKYLIAASLTNIVLDLLFVAVLGYGVGAAALATVLSQCLSAALAFVRLVRAKGEYRVSPRHIRFDGEMLRQVVGLGLPSGVQNSVISLANIFVQSNINAFGAMAMAGCGAYSKIEGFGFLPVTCFTLALSTFVSQNLGAKQYERAKKGARFGILCSVLTAECIGGAIWLLAPRLIALFNADPAVVAFGVLQARTVTLFYCLLAFSHCIAAILRGSGKAVVPMAVMLCFWCVVRICYITAAVRIVPEIQVVFWAYPLTWTLSSLVFLWYYRRGAWLHGFDCAGGAA